MDALGNRLRRAFDLQPLPPRKKTATNKRDKFSAMSRRAASLDALGDHEAVTDSMFGGMIGDAVDKNTGINKFVQWCIQAIETTGEGLKTDGIYRVTTGQVGAKRISWQHEQSMPRVLERESNVHVLTAALRLFFKSLKQPVMRVEDFQTAMQPHLNDMETAELLRQVIYSLPLAERSTLAYLFLHLNRVVAVQENNMTLATLSACFGPTLLRLRTEFSAQASMAKDMKQQNRLVGQLLLHSEVVFGAARMTAQVTGDVADCARDGDSDSSSFTSDDADESIGSILQTPELAATVDKYKTKSTNSTKKKRILEEKMDSSSSDSDESETDAPMKQRVLVASADNYKRNSSLSSNKGNVFRDKISVSSSNDPKIDSLNKKQALGKSADKKRNSSLSSNKDESVFRDKISSSSSNDTKRDSITNKKMALGKSADKKRNSSLSSIKESVLRDKTDSSSSDEGKTDSAIKDPALVARVNNASHSENKDTLFRDRIESSSSDKDKSGAPTKKRALAASADVYKRHSFMSANKESVFREKIDSSSSEEDTRMKQDVLFASTNRYSGNYSLPAINTDVISQDKVDSSSSEEIKDIYSDKKVKQATSAKTIIKKMRNKLFPFRATKNKHKSSSSLNEQEGSDSAVPTKQLTVNEIDALSMKTTEFVPEYKTSVVSPTTMTTFKYSFAKDPVPDQKLKYQSGGVETNKVEAKITENIMADGLLKFKLISSSSSSSSDEDYHPTLDPTTTSKKKPAIIRTILGRIKRESTTNHTKVNNISKTVTQTEQQHDRPNEFTDERIVKNMLQTKQKIPPANIQQKSFSAYKGDNLHTSADKKIIPITNEAIDFTERKVNLNTSSEIAKASSLDTTLEHPNRASKEIHNQGVSKEQHTKYDGESQHLVSADNLEYNLNKTKQMQCSVTSSDEGSTVEDVKNDDVATSFLEDVSKQNVTKLIHDNLSSKMKYSSKKNMHNDSPLQNRHVTVSATANDSSIFAQPEIYSDVVVASTNPVIASNNAVSERKEYAIYASVNKLKPSAAVTQPDIFKPTQTLTEVFNSNSIHSTYYAPPLGSGDETSGSVASSNNTTTLESRLKKKYSSSSSSEESFSDSSGDHAPTRPPPPPPDSQIESQSTLSADTGIKIHSSVPTAL